MENLYYLPAELDPIALFCSQRVVLEIMQDKTQCECKPCVALRVEKDRIWIRKGELSQRQMRRA